MMSPIRRFDSRSPKKGRRRFIREDESDNNVDASFDLFDQDPESSCWYSVRIPGKLPHKRSFHTSALVNDMYKNHKIRLYIIGGMDLMEDCYSDVWRISMDDVTNMIRTGACYKQNIWELVKTTGEGPTSISNHKAVVMESLIYVYGGLINNENQKNSLFTLDITNHAWHRIVTKVFSNLIIGSTLRS